MEALGELSFVPVWCGAGAQESNLGLSTRLVTFPGGAKGCKSLDVSTSGEGSLSPMSWTWGWGRNSGEAAGSLWLRRAPEGGLGDCRLGSCWGSEMP